MEADWTHALDDIVNLRGATHDEVQAWADEVDRKMIDDLLASIALYINWRYVTKQLTTPQKEAFADAIERSVGGSVSYAERWWRQESA